MHENVGIIVAAGKGIRMGGKTRKQYLPIDTLPVVSYALRAFDDCRDVSRLFLVIPEEDAAYCKNKLLTRIFLQKPVDLVYGGQYRQESVFNALQAAGGLAEVVAIHDGVRPFILPEQISETIRWARSVGAAVLATPATDTLKRADSKRFVRETIDRRNVWAVQTPQAFRYEIIRRAHENARNEGRQATDDAQLVEKLGVPVKIVPGSRFNFKITTPEDYRMARAFWHQKK